MKQCEVEPEWFDVSHIEVEKRIGQYVSILMTYDPNDTFFTDKTGVGLQHARVEGNTGSSLLIFAQFLRTIFSSNLQCTT